MIQVDLSHIRSLSRCPTRRPVPPSCGWPTAIWQHGDGAGGEFTGWVQLPRQYDREEFARIQAAAEKFSRTLRRW